MSLAHGTLLGGRYRVVRLVGRGGMGAVYEAVDERARRRVALKVLLGVDGAGVERFRREAQAAAALGHPHIVAMLDFSAGAPGEPPFLVMELLEGTSLGAVIDRQGPMPLGRAAVIALQILDALSIAHRGGIIHRDIKPDNVFLTRGPTGGDFVKLLDFGVAKIDAGDQAPLTRAGQVLGSPAYMAPEQARGAPVDVRADLYAVGATMLHALSGRLPSYASGAATSDAPRSISAAVPLSSLRGDLPPAFAGIVDRAMASDPNLRFGNADEMRAALAPWAAADGALSQALPSVPLPSLGFSPTLGAADPHAATIAPRTQPPPTAPAGRATGVSATSPHLPPQPSPSAEPPGPALAPAPRPGPGPAAPRAWPEAPPPTSRGGALAAGLAVAGVGILGLLALGVGGAIVYTRRAEVAVAPAV
ncbi:MAG: serine/threonine protein kinase, partial [Myxococcales bacterium]|nr:serine/threonine protein kinase [Myxococcales bacterium]